jgi:uncharacterized protein (TIGR02453 family)
VTEARYFTLELFSFLRALRRHNTREWFARNKRAYEQFVLWPSLAFISDMQEVLPSTVSYLGKDTHARGSTFRIYRDLRFTSDRRPFKSHVGIKFEVRSLRSSADAPMLYVHLEPSRCFYAAGLWRPNSKTLSSVRSYICINGDDWTRISGKLDLRGRSLKGTPRGFSGSHPMIRDLRRRDFVISRYVGEDEIAGEAFVDSFLYFSKKSRVFMNFLAKALERPR